MVKVYKHQQLYSLSRCNGHISTASMILHELFQAARRTDWNHSFAVSILEHRQMLIAYRPA